MLHSFLFTKRVSIVFFIFYWFSQEYHKYLQSCKNVQYFLKINMKYVLQNFFRNLFFLNFVFESYPRIYIHHEFSFIIFKFSIIVTVHWFQVTLFKRGTFNCLFYLETLTGKQNSRLCGINGNTSFSSERIKISPSILIKQKFK